MKTRWVIVVAVAMSLLVAACGGDDDNGTTAPGRNDDAPSSVGDAAKGQDLFNNSCATCHGVDGRDPSVGKGLRDSQWVADASDTDLIATITQGRSPFDAENTTGIDMPAKGGDPSLSDADIADIAAYIRTINAP